MKPTENLTLEEIDQRIARTAVEAAIEIGYYLKQIRDRKLYEQAGCRNVYEYAEKQYGYDRSTTSRNMSRNDRFSVGGNSPELAERYLGYGKSQLQEMISMTDEQLGQVKPEMTVQEMKDLKKKPEKAQKKPEVPDKKAVATLQYRKLRKPDERIQKYLNDFAENFIHFNRDWMLEDFHNRVMNVTRSPEEIRNHVHERRSDWPFVSDGDAFRLEFYNGYVQLWSARGFCIGDFDEFYLGAAVQRMWNKVALKEAEKSWKKVPEPEEKKSNLREEEPEEGQKESKIPDQKAVATSQQDEENSCPPDIPGCRRQEWGLSEAQQKQGKKECGECWSHWKQLHPEKQPKQEEKKQELSAYGLPVLEYPPDSLLTGPGCGEYGGVLYDCFSCHMNNCQIRQQDCYCVEAPMGNPFFCGILTAMEQEHVRRAVEDHPCQFLDHDLAEHAAGDGSAVPCCKNCDTPCAYQCNRAAAVREKEEEPEERVIDGDCREVEDLTEDDRYEETSEKTDRELAQGMLEKENQTLKLILDAFTEDEEYARKQKILVAALAGYICDLDIQQDQEDRIQPELPVLRNNDQRKEWLRNYKDWGLWYEDENIGAKYYKYDFANGARLIAEVYQEPETKHVPAYESSHLHLVGGPKPPRNGFLDKWTRHEKYNRYPNNETELVEFLKEAQRNG